MLFICIKENTSFQTNFYFYFYLYSYSSAASPHLCSIVNTASDGNFLFDVNARDEVVVCAKHLSVAPSITQIPHSDALVIAH